MNTSTCYDLLASLSAGIHILPTMPLDASEWTFTAHGFITEGRILPPSKWDAYFASEYPCLGLAYGGGSFVYVLPTSACSPELLEFLSDEDSAEWEMWEFDADLPYVLIDLSASGDVVMSLPDLSLESLRLD